MPTADDVYFYDFGGVPTLAYGYAYDVEGKNKRESVYGQDQWTFGRVTANLGLRFDRIRGDDAPTATSLLTPAGARASGWPGTFSAGGTSVLRRFYGHLYDGAMFSIWNRAVPGIGDYVIYDVCRAIA